MSEYLPAELRADLKAAQVARALRSSRLRLESRSHIVRVLSRDAASGAEAVTVAEDAPHLRGVVDLYDDSRRLGRFLIVGTEAAPLGRRYRLRRSVEDGAMAAGPIVAPDAPQMAAAMPGGLPEAAAIDPDQLVPTIRIRRA
ncbi:MAG: hypothetical protein ACU0BF_05865 [Paracoccaceae bacterium]